MRAILPGRPQSRRQALCTAQWDGLRLIAYISGNTAIILRDPKDIVQTISIDHVESLSAITIDEISGRIAICDEQRVLVFDALGRDEDDLRWTQAHDITIPDNGSIRSLSWGSSEELLVGGTQLWLYHLPYSDHPQLIWQQPLANEVALAYFSNDAELIASCGQHDKLVKIWRRLSFELDSTRFDVYYLPHPAAVTDLHWRKPWHNEQNLDSLLYTFCVDNQVRVWAYSDPHSLSMVQLIATIDTNISIEPRRRSIGSLSQKRYVFILDSRDFSSATECAIQQLPSHSVDHALEHLIEIANRTPEFCVVFDGRGHMSVWGLENAGCKSRKPTVVFNVTLVDEVNVQLNFSHGKNDDYSKFCVFGGGSSPATLSLLVHSFTGQIDWYESSITHFFDTAARKDRFKLLSSWSGHNLSIDHVARGSRGDHILSWTDEGQAILWAQSQVGALRRQCEINTGNDILSVIHFDTVGYSLLLHSDAVSLWDLQNGHGVRVATGALTPRKLSISIQRFGTVIKGARRAYFAINFENGAMELWQTRFPTGQEQTAGMNGSFSWLSKVFDLEHPGSDGRQAISCDVTSSMRYLDALVIGRARFYMNSDGHIETYLTHCDTPSEAPREVRISRCVTNTLNINLVRASTSNKCALVSNNKKRLAIWDLEQGVCEWNYTVDSTDEIRKVAWASTSYGNLFLFVGFSYHALIVGQFRYPATSMTQNPWYITQNLSLRDFTTFHIGDVCWLSSGDLAIGAGNQIFVVDNVVTERDSPILKRNERIVKRRSAGAVIDIANAILPIFHADFLEALVFESGPAHAEKILQILYEKLKYFSDGDELASDLGISVPKLLFSQHGLVMNGIAQTDGDDDSDKEYAELKNIEDSFSEYIEMSDIWQLGPKKRQNITKVLANLIKIGRHRNSLDDNALRYLYALYNTPEDQNLHWRAFVFASRSTSQEALIDLITQHHNGKVTWSVARRTGIFVWLEDKAALQTQLENIGRNEFTKHEDRNPVDCSLYYFALNKKTVLQGLWRMSFGIKEKENTMKLLAHNFEEPRWRATASKNAYALLSKRRFEYGAAFFLLGGSLKDAVNVCVNQLDDIQLAVAITRVWDRAGDESEQVLRDLMERHLLKQSVDSEQGRWMAAWAYTILNRPAQALQALVRSLHEVTETNLGDANGPLKSMSFRANDPHVTVLYAQLRQSLIKHNKWTADVLSQKEEWDFVIRNARWWTRAGMDYLALRLLREWEFVPHQQPKQSVAPTTLVVPAGEATGTDFEQKAETSKLEKEKEKKKKKPPPTQFFEPSADSLLDSFGF